jgi:hypothetical protein
MANGMMILVVTGENSRQPGSRPARLQKNTRGGIALLRKISGVMRSLIEGPPLAPARHSEPATAFARSVPFFDNSSVALPTGLDDARDLDRRH